MAVANHLGALEGIQAVYRDEISLYEGNPLIEAMPPYWTPRDWAYRLAHYPPVDTAERTLDCVPRQHLTMTVLKYFQPLDCHLDLAEAINRILRLGYVGRNPTDKDFYQRIRLLRQGLHADGRLTPAPVVEAHSGTTFSLIGPPGTGKTVSVGAILSQFPQLIRHREYRGREFVFDQLVYLSIQCPHDGSLRALCGSFFLGVDSVLGTNYHYLFIEKQKRSADDLLPFVVAVASLTGLGLLVIDEINALSLAHSGGAKSMLQFLVQLQNAIGVPVITMGTLSAHRILAAEIHSARRASGQGAFIWYPMQAQSGEWDLFVKGMWRYQYLRNEFELTPELSKALWDGSGGIADIATKLYIVAQVRAIAVGARKGGIERLTPALIKSVASDYFALVADYVKYLRNKDLTALSKFEDAMIMEVRSLIAAEQNGSGFISGLVSRPEGPPIDLLTMPVKRPDGPKRQSRPPVGVDGLGLIEDAGFRATRSDIVE